MTAAATAELAGPELVARLADATAETLSLLPTIERLTGIFAEAERIALEAVPVGPYSDLPAIDRFYADTGAHDLGDALRTLTLAMTTPAGTWIPA